MNTTFLLTALLVTTSLATTVTAQTLTTGLPPATIMKQSCDVRTEIDELPFTITKPGSYVVTCDLHGSPGKVAILLGASDVTIDLAGHTLSGDGSANGIVPAASVGNLQNIAIRNGTLSNWGIIGIDLRMATGVFLEDLLVSGSGNAGVETGSCAAIIRCSLNDNGTGAACYGAALLHEMTASNNDTYGAFQTTGAVVTSSSFDGNGFAALTTANAVIDSCVVSNNNAGITSLGATVVIECTVSDNLNWGVSHGDASVTANCAVSGNERGILAQNPFAAHVLIDNTTTNNTGVGIRTGWSCLVRGNVSSENGEEGIDVYEDSFVVDNLVYGNVGDGILAASESNRIDGNNVTQNARGVVVLDPSCIVTRNKATLNGPDFDVPVGTWFGTVAASMTTATPWGNFSY